jgi:hypothetical protein
MAAVAVKSENIQLSDVHNDFKVFRDIEPSRRAVPMRFPQMLRL